ncbi:MAG TPA: TonB family protein [Candidatus Udaeobacter sp.]|nr:TonB family protein [Candidatus Udaeobacter sp.]
MAIAASNSMDRFGSTRYEDQSLRQFLIYSIIMHASLAVVIIVSAYIQFRQSRWGGVGGELGGTKVNLVSAAGIPLPKEAVVTESKAVDPTKGLYKEEPPKPPELKTEATKIPKFEKEKKLPPSPKSRTFESKTPPPDNAVPYGKGGNPDLPTGYSQTPGAGSSGVTVQGQGGADFASRYGWYIEAVKNRIYSNWQQWTIDAAARTSRTMHCAVSFTINRDGSLKDWHISESSGNSSYDNSALRAVMSSNPVTKLPGDYAGSYVVATLDFNPPSIR